MIESIQKLPFHAKDCATLSVLTAIRIYFAIYKTGSSIRD